MSIASEITRIKNNIADSYDYCAAKGALMPSELLQDSDHLANTINTITELRGQQLTINEYTPVGTVFYPTGTYNGITQATVSLHHCDLVIAPSTSQQEFDIFTIHSSGVVPPEVVNDDGHVGFANVKVGAVTSSIDQNIISSNIKDGVTILGVTGDYVCQPYTQTLNITPSTSSQVFTDYGASVGYTGFSPVNVNAVDHTIDPNIEARNIKSGVTILGVTGNVVEASLGSIVVYPSTTAQRILPSGPYNGYDEISVAPVDSTIDNNILSYNIRNGVTILGVTGDYVGQANPNPLSITPSTSSQYFSDYGSSLGYTGFGPVSVSAVTSSIDGNIDPDNIKDGVTILGVTGNYTGTTINNDSLNVTPTTSQQTFTTYGSSLGYTGFDPVTVDAVDYTIDSNIQSSNIKDGVTILGVTGSVTEAVLDSASVTPSTSSQLITPSGVYNGFYEINVDAVDDTIDSNIQSYNIKDGVSILGVTGSLIEVNGATEYVTPTTSQQSIYPTSPYNCFTEIVVDAVDDSIDPNITAGNIKDGVTILGVTGTYTGGGVTPTGTYNISSNGVYDITNYANVDVNVPSGPTAQTPITCTSKTLTLDKAWLKDISLQSNGNDLVIDVTYGVQGNYSQGNITINAQDLMNLQWMSGTFDFYLNLDQINQNQAQFRLQQQQVQGSYAKINLTASGGSITFNSAGAYYPMNYWSTIQ